MKVKAKVLCFIGGARRKPGDVFEFKGEPTDVLEVVEPDAGPEPKQDVAPADGKTRKEIMLELDAADIKYGVNDNKDVLLALLNSVKQDVAPAASFAPPKEQTV